MQILHSFFGLIFTVGIIVCGLKWMLSADRGLDILQRLCLSLLLFSAATMFVPNPGTNLIVGGLQIVTAFTLFLAAALALVNLHGTAGTGCSVGAIVFMVLIVMVGIRLLLQVAPSGVLVLAGVVIFAIYVASRTEQL